MAYYMFKRPYPSNVEIHDKDGVAQLTVLAQPQEILNLPDDLVIDPDWWDPSTEEAWQAAQPPPAPPVEENPPTEETPAGGEPVLPPAGEPPAGEPPTGEPPAGADDETPEV